MRRIFLYCFAVSAIFVFSCKGEGGKDATMAKDSYEIERNIVDTIHLYKRPFFKETVSNGVLKGARIAQLQFRLPGIIDKVCVRNGSEVRQGDIVAVLNTESLELELERSRHSLQKAQLDLYDALIGFGYGRDTLNVPSEILGVAKIRSGYAMALNSYNVALLNYNSAKLVAPIGGVVANLSINPYEYTSGPVCSIIDNSSFKVEFPVLEAELPYLNKGHNVVVRPFADMGKSYSGTITEVNPFVDSKGQVKVVAKVIGTDNYLMEGMNVKIIIRSKGDEVLVVPKSAVVMRDGYDVLFVYDGIKNEARWRYVDILHSNSTHHVVRGSELKGGTLKEGEAVIVNGNLNLADGSPVVLNKRK